MWTEAPELLEECVIAWRGNEERRKFPIRESNDEGFIFFTTDWEKFEYVCCDAAATPAVATVLPVRFSPRR